MAFSAADALPRLLYLVLVLAAGCASDGETGGSPGQGSSGGPAASPSASGSGGSPFSGGSAGNPAASGEAGAPSSGGSAGNPSASGGGESPLSAGAAGTPSASGAGGSPSGGAPVGGSTADGGSPEGGKPSAGAGATSDIAAQLPASCPGTCNAATPSYPEFFDEGALGNVTMYSTSASDGGACQYGSTGILYFAASNVHIEPGDFLGQWQDGRLCGQCFEVTVLTSSGLASTVVRITDRCADADCGLDLGGEAPAAVMRDGFGRYDGAWQPVSCVGHPEVYDGAPSLFVKEGSNAFWSAVQVRNPDAAVTGISWQSQGEPARSGELPYGAPSVENHYLVPEEVLGTPGSYRLTVHYADASSAATTLTAAELGTPDASYPL